MTAGQLSVGNFFTIKETRDDGVVIDIYKDTVIYMDLFDKNTKIIKSDIEVINVF